MPGPTPIVGPVEPPELHTMTLNLRRRVPRPPSHPDAWERRRDAVAALVRSERPHLLAVQEALPDQADWLTAAIGERWHPVLVGRGRRGTGERVGMFVDGERLREVSRHSWALSRHPQRPGSRSWGSAFPRLAVGAVLDDRATGVRFLAVATHLDHLSPLARIRSCRLIARIVAERGLPAVLLADANCRTGSAPWRVMADAGFVDSWHRASRLATEEYGTYPHYREPRVGARRIDWILVRAGDGIDPAVTTAAIGTRRPGGVWPSDHAAVHAVLDWRTS